MKSPPVSMPNKYQEPEYDASVSPVLLHSVGPLDQTIVFPSLPTQTFVRPHCLASALPLPRVSAGRFSRRVRARNDRRPGAHHYRSRKHRDRGLASRQRKPPGCAVVSQTLIVEPALAPTGPDNTLASIDGTGTGSLTEGSATTVAAGKLTVTDPDSGEGRFQWPSVPSLYGLYGTFTFDALTGDWNYTLHNASLATRVLTEGQMASDG